MLRRCLLASLAVLALALPAAAQSYRESLPTPLAIAEALVSLDVRGMGTATVEVTNTYSGTITFEVAGAQGGFTAINCTPPNSTTAVTTTTTTGRWGSCNVAGYVTFRARMSTYTSGSALVSLSAAGTGGGGGGGGSSSCTGCTGGDFDIATFNAAFGTAGTADSQVMSIQGIASGTAITVASHAVTNAGTFAVQATNGGTFVTQENGAALTALQLIDNIVGGSAGTPDADVLSVQGIASMTPLLVTASATNLDVQIGGSDTLSVQSNSLNLVPGLAEDGVHASGEAGALMLAVRQDSQVDFAADGDRVPLSIDADGNLRVAFSGAAGGTSATDNGTFTAGGTAQTPIGGYYQTSVSACTDDNTCAVGITVGRAMKVALANSDGSLATYATDMTIGSAFGSTGPGLVGSYKIFDGAALPTTANVNTEEEAAPIAVTLQGIQFGFLTNVDGSKQLGKLEDDAHASADYGVPVWARRIDAAAVSGGSDADYSTFNVDALGLLWTRSLDPCSGVAKTTIPISIATATTTELTSALAGASTNYYVCSINLVAAAAQTLALADDDTDNCASVTAGMAGGTTAAAGWSFGANGGIVLGNGSSTVLKTNGTNRVICAVTGQAAQISGTIVVVAAP